MFENKTQSKFRQYKSNNHGFFLWSIQFTFLK